MLSLTGHARVLVAQLCVPTSDVLEHLREYERLDYTSLIRAMQDHFGDARFQKLHFSD